MGLDNFISDSGDDSEESSSTENKNTEGETDVDVQFPENRDFVEKLRVMIMESDSGIEINDGEVSASIEDLTVFFLEACMDVENADPRNIEDGELE